MREFNTESKDNRVIVAMSGGVDSSVAAALLVRDGFDVIGIMMRLWSEEANGHGSSVNRCCTPDQMADARRVARQLGIPFYVLDAQEVFRRSIVQDFINQHQAGLTPNPCIGCNRQIRFSYLLQHARALGARYLATGHYARIRETDGGYQLLRGVDPHKDQSYVLHVLSQEKLAHVLFPVGEYTKEEVRALARQLELPVAAKQDSQDLCFVADGDHKRFLRQYGHGRAEGGPIVDQNGKQIGYHDGLPYYTIGQRKGLGVSAEYPLYVLQKDGRQNVMVVGPREALACKTFQVRDVNWVGGESIPSSTKVQVMIRYKARAVTGRIGAIGIREVVVYLDTPVLGVTPGQGAVFFDGDVCLGGGIIAGDVAASQGTEEGLQKRKGVR